MRWLKLKFLRGHRQHRNRIRDWIEVHPRLVRVLERGGALHIDETTLARGMAVGLFVGMTPTVGIQTVLMLVAAFAFRANFLAAFLISNVSNPLTMAPLYYGWNRLGHWLIDRLPIEPVVIDSLGEEVAFETLAMFIGSLLTALPASALGYFGFLWLWRKLGWTIPRTQRKTQAGAEPGITRISSRDGDSSSSGSGW